MTDKVIENLIFVFKKIRNKSLETLFNDYLNKSIDDEQLIEELQSLQEYFPEIEVDKNGDPILLNDMIELREGIIFPININFIEKGEYYDLNNNVNKYTIIINNIKRLIFDTKQERDKNYILIKDTLSLIKQYRFNIIK